MCAAVEPIEIGDDADSAGRGCPYGEKDAVDFADARRMCAERPIMPVASDIADAAECVVVEYRTEGI